MTALRGGGVHTASGGVVRPRHGWPRATGRACVFRRVVGGQPDGESTRAPSPSETSESGLLAWGRVPAPWRRGGDPRGSGSISRVAWVGIGRVFPTHPQAAGEEGPHAGDDADLMVLRIALTFGAGL